MRCVGSQSSGSGGLTSGVGVISGGGRLLAFIDLKDQSGFYLESHAQ